MLLVNAIAEHASDKALEGWAFAHLHKWQWLEVIGRWPRDLLMMACALGAAGVGVLGLLLFLRRPPEIRCA